MVVLGGTTDEAVVGFSFRFSFRPGSLMLLTDLLARVRDSESLWWMVEIYLTRWKN
jgi:hypothetical protein